MRIRSGIPGLFAALGIFAAIAAANAGSASDPGMNQKDVTEDRRARQERSSSMNSTKTAKDVQQALNSRGYDAGPADGNWRSKSKAALSKFQGDNGLKPTGQINDDVLVALGVVPAETGAAAGGQVTPGDQQGSPSLEGSSDQQQGKGKDQGAKGRQSNSPIHQGENQPGTGG